MSWRAVKGGEYQKGSGYQLDRVKKICYNKTGGAHSYKYVYTATGAIHSIESTESGSPIGMQYRTTSYAANTFDTFYFEKNLQGDIVAIYNANGVEVLSYTYDAWGNHTTTWHNSSGTNINATYNPFRYRGYYYDTETGLYYLQSRYYNPAWGRFLNLDEYLSTGTGLIGYNMYTYCDNNPVVKVDPAGYFGISTSCDLEDRYDILRDESEVGAGSSYRTYVVRSKTAAHDAFLGNYYGPSITPSMLNPYGYYVPGAVTVTDSMVEGPQARFGDKTDPKHVFRNADGHIKQDTPANRELLEKATLKKNYSGTDARGNRWYAYIDQNGHQVWVSARGDCIRNGGINEVPMPWDPVTGYCRNPNKK